MNLNDKSPQPVRRGWLSRWLTVEGAPRIIILGLLIVALFVGFGRRLWYLQFVRGDYYSERANRQSTRPVTLPAPRGLIYDRSGDPLVRNIPSFYVTIVPGYLPDDEDTTDDNLLGEKAETVLIRLAMLLDIPYTTSENGEETDEDEEQAGLRDTILKAFEEGAYYQPLVVKRRVERNKALLIAQETTTLPGVSVEAESVRDYPYGTLVSQILGYLLPAPDTEEYREQGYDPSVDRIGVAGVEATYEDALRGQKGRQIVEEDVLGRVIRVVEEQTVPVPGDNVHLTINLDLQHFVETALWEGMTKPDVNSPRGVAIVMNPKTGEILSMVSLPTYDNNLFVRGVKEQELDILLDNPHSPLLNHAISGGVPPGSVFKIVVASGVLQEDVATPQTQLRCPGKIIVPNKYYPNDPGRAQPFYCWNKAGHGALSLVDGIAHSCDIYFYKVGGGFEETDFDGLGVSRIADYARMFGFGEPTGVELPVEISGVVPTADWKRLTYGESWSTGDTYNLSIGQGYLSVTPLQMLNAINVIANGGTLYQPTIVHHVTDSHGEIVESFEPEIIRQVDVDPEYLALVRQGMAGAVDYGTAARRGQIEDLSIAGKTGTAQFCDNIMCGVGFEQPEHAWFAAFAPVEEPEISVIIFLYNGGEGSVAAVPVAHDILAHYFTPDNANAEE